MKIAKMEYSRTRGGSHDWSHIARVINYCKEISPREGADLEIVLPAAVLHDIGREGEKIHGSSQQIVKILDKAGYKGKELSPIVECIVAHSTYSNSKPRSIEAKVLFDADKLDSYGAIGVSRFFLLCGEQNLTLSSSVNKALDRITKLNKLSGFYTKTGRELGLSKAKKAFMFYYLLFSELGNVKQLKHLENLLMGQVGGINTKLFKLAIAKLFE